LISNPKFNPTGRFGVGFYASFMLGNRIKVMSRPYQGGLYDRKVLRFTGIRGRAELRDYDPGLDGHWDYEATTIIEIEVNDERFPSSIARLSAFGAIERPIMENEEKFWDFFSLTMKRLVFCLDVPVFLTAPFADGVLTNNVDIFELPNSDFAREFNAVFSTDDKHCVIPDELVPLVDFIGDKEHKSRGSVRNGDIIWGMYHIGGLTVFSPEAGGVLGARGVTGVHLATPITVSRHSPRRAVQKSLLLEWAERQKSLLDSLEQSSRKKGESLLSLRQMGLDLGDKYFLCDINGEIVFFVNMDISSGDKVFICCNRHPFVNRIEILQQQDIFMFCDRGVINNIHGVSNTYCNCLRR
jgi:hypothetical protein